MHDILSDIMAESLKNKAKPENKKNLEFLQKEGGSLWHFTENRVILFKEKYKGGICYERIDSVIEKRDQPRFGRNRSRCHCTGFRKSGSGG